MTSMARIGAAFAALALALLAAVALLLHSALGRLETQRALRHRMVAERIFDEAERELNALLQHEAKRPSAAYDAVRTRVSRWAPFVVGYVKLDPDLLIVAQEQLTPRRVHTVRQAVAKAAPDADRRSGRRPHARPAAEQPLGPGPLAAAARVSSPNVLRRLNRSASVRARTAPGHGSEFRAWPTGGDTLVLLRDAPKVDRREGFVVDVRALVTLVQQWLITAQGLSDVASLALGPATATATAADDTYAFEHTLAAPFSSHRLSLQLARLDDADERGALLALAGLLMAAALAGMLALYRMVRVQVRFAERRNNFVSAVTHELKTPLTAIRMYSEMLSGGMAADEKTRGEYYDILTSEAERLTRLINNVMEHGQLRKGQRPMQLCEGPVEPILRDVLDVMAPHIRHEGFALSTSFEDGVRDAHFDPDALKQVLFNVLDNALKYGGGAERRIDVRLEMDDVWVAIEIRDRGPGVGPAQLPHLFEAFFRAEDELTRSRTGTGIGLSLVRDLVRGMGGEASAHPAQPGLRIRVRLQPA